MLPHVPADVRRLLDVGCAAGEFGRLVKERGAERVVGVERDPIAAQMARSRLDSVVEGDIEAMDLPFDDCAFDCVACCDVLEHMADPWTVLKKLLRVLTPGGKLIISLPNVGFYNVLELLLRGRWPYMDAGVLDRTHLRFFTAAEAQEMVRSTGYVVEGTAPLCALDPNRLPLDAERCVQLPRMRLGPLADEEYVSLRTFQFLVVARRPDGDPLGAAMEAYLKKDYVGALDIASRSPGNERERMRIVAKASARLGRLEDALQAFQSVLANHSDDGETATDVALTLIAAGRVAEARDYVGKALERDPDSDRALSAAGLAAIADGDETGALAYLDAALERNFDNEPVLRHALMLAARLNRLDILEPHLRRFVQLYPAHLGFSLEYAAYLRARGRSVECREVLGHVLLLSPDHPEAQRLLREVGGEGSGR